MPLYELFCLARPRLGKAALAEIIRGAGNAVLARGGVVTDVKSFGEQPLAYEIRRPGARHASAAMWQLTFAADAAALRDVDHALRVDERVVRWALLRRRALPPLPNPFQIARAAERAAAAMEGEGGAAP
jgi:small subunit ribosomal protein S6